MSNYSRQYTTRINNDSGWENYTSTATPLSAANLNKMDAAIQNIDYAAYTAINSKADQTTVNTCVRQIELNSTTGVITITYINGTTATINTVLEKVVTNFRYDSDTQSLVLTLEDGTTQSIDLSDFITEYEFNNSDTIAFTITEGEVSAEIVDGSITGEKLDPDYLTDCETQVSNAKSYARTAQSYALGNAVDDEGDPFRPGQATDNAKYYCQKAQEAAADAGAEDFIGATESTGGVHGLVPAPLIADKDKYLKGDGSWAAVDMSVMTGASSITAGTAGKVPAPDAGDEGKFLRGDATWATVDMSVMTGATSSTAGASGKVPAPAAGDQSDFLQGDGTWNNDTANLTVTGTSQDDSTTTDLITDTEASVATITSGESHTSLFNKITGFALNLRRTINAVKSIWAQQAENWESGTEYAVYNIRHYGGKLYKCILAHTSSSSILPTNTTYWEETTVGGEISSQNANYANITSYSTTEKAVGTWIDGKQIYRKVLSKNQSIAANTYTLVTFSGITNLSTVVSVDILYHQTDNSWIVGTNETGSRAVWAFFNPNGVGVGVKNSQALDEIICKVEYTKT